MRERPAEDDAVHAVPQPRAPKPSAATAQVAALFERHHESVFRAAYRITGDPRDAEDVLQTVFLRLVRREDPVELGETEASYLHRAAVNAALDLLRRRKAARAIALEEVAEPAAAAGGADAAHELGELRARLRDALAFEPPRAAAIFVLRHFEGHGNREIARMLGTSWSTVAVTLHRTRARLRKRLQGDRP